MANKFLEKLNLVTAGKILEDSNGNSVGSINIYGKEKAYLTGSYFGQLMFCLYDQGHRAFYTTGSNKRRYQPQDEVGENQDENLDP